MESNEEYDFILNEKVVRKNTNEVGIVIGILPDKQYLVFFSQKQQIVCAEQDLVRLTAKVDFIHPLEFLKNFLVFKLQKPLSNILYSYSMSKTNREAYQFKPAIKFLKNPKNRILIADEVGLGKTIEACIIYLELKARMQGDIPRVLIVCPAGLKEKWQSELLLRFEETFELLDTKKVMQFLEHYDSAHTTRLKGICSIETLRQEEIQVRINEVNPQFDLIVVDEAHHMRNPERLSFDLGQLLEDCADSYILMTATPVQLRSSDLFYLLNILDPGQFEDESVFRYQLEPNKHINKVIAELANTACDYDRICRTLDAFPANIKDNPYYQEARGLVYHAMHVSEIQDKRKSLVLATRSLYQLNPFALVFNRTRRKEVMQGALRRATVIDIKLSEIEKQIYHEALNFARLRLGTEFSLGIIQIERMIASSIGAYKEILENVKLDKRYARIESSSTSLEFVDQLPGDGVEALWYKVKNLYNMLGNVDSKFDHFKAELFKILGETDTTKVIVYSFFKPTLKYLKRKLTEAGVLTELIDGDVPVANRKALMKKFKESPEIRVLLSSEVGAEGLDFQFCNCVINYDLPWNPMRVEQRIGRVDRYGQTSPWIAVVSFFLSDTIEDRILKRLYERIRVFEESVGSLEPILGNVEKELAYEIISKSLTSEQERQKTEQYLRMIEFRQKEIEDFEKYRYELMGQDTAFADEIDNNISSGRYVAPSEIRALITSYLNYKCPLSYLKEVEREKDNWVLEPENDLCTELRSHIFKQKYKATKHDNEFFIDLQKRVNNPKHIIPKGIPITFSSDLAIERPLLEFVNISHPLTMLAFQEFSALSYENAETRMIRFKVINKQNVKNGKYYFYIFWLSIEAITRYDELIPLCLNVKGEIEYKLSDQFLRFIYDNLSDQTELLDESEFAYEIFKTLENTAHKYMASIRNESEINARQRNDALIAVRRDAITKTFEAKIKRVDNRLENAKSQRQDPRLIRMFEGEKRNLINKMEGSIKEVESKQKISVAYEPVCYGMFELV